MDGLSFELVYLNLFGFTYFSLFVTLGYFDKEYEADTGEVDIQDVFFGYHSLLLTIICLGQCFYYPRSSSKKIASWCFWMIVIMNTLLLIDYILQKINIVEKFAEFSVLRLLGYFKLIITIIKYIPQVIWMIYIYIYIVIQKLQKKKYKRMEYSWSNARWNRRHFCIDPNAP